MQYLLDSFRFPHSRYWKQNSCSDIVVCLYRSFGDSMSTLRPGKSWGTKLSSAGLVYLYYGHQVLAQILELKKDDALTDIVFDLVYENLIEEVDGVDNGVNQYDGEPR